jgi:hypothetical protein
MATLRNLAIGIRKPAEHASIAAATPARLPEPWLRPGLYPGMTETDIMPLAGALGWQLFESIRDELAFSGSSPHHHW